MSIADELITRGWTKMKRENATGNVCLMGAAGYATTGRPRSMPGQGRSVPLEVERLLKRIVRQHSPGARSVVDFNDDLDRTFDEVLRVAKEADEILSGYQGAE